jgi:hypothetical protein
MISAGFLGCKISIQKSVVFLQTCCTHSKNLIRKIISFAIASERAECEGRPVCPAEQTNSHSHYQKVDWETHLPK